MTPFGFLGGIHRTSMQADPSALTTGGLRSIGAASCVLPNILLLTPQLPSKKTSRPSVIYQAGKRELHMHTQG